MTSTAKGVGKALASEVTPMMQQYLQAKQQHPDAVVFFRLGDFYEMFFDDARLGARLLDLTLTARGTTAGGEKIPMAGVPHHAASGYIAKLLQLGQRVALCEQMEDPSKVKGMVRREVVRVITPGLCLEGEGLEASLDSYLVAVVAEPEGFGLAAYQLSTAELRLCCLADESELLAELSRLAPRELLPIGDWPEARRRACQQILGTQAIWCAPQPLDEPAAARALQSSTAWQAISSSWSELPGCTQRAAHCALAYAKQQKAVGDGVGVQSLQIYDPKAQLVLDENAVRQLELVRTFQGDRDGSLLAWLDGSCTSMGARLLRRRLLAPLTDVAAIRQRHAAVEALVADAVTRRSVRQCLREVGDLERLATRVAYGVATPREVAGLRRALQQSAALATLLHEAASSPVLASLLAVDRCEELCGELERQLVDEPPVSLQEGGIFRPGVDASIDRWQAEIEQCQTELLQLEERERQRTGIASLKVGYTRVFGHYIEISRSRLAAVPADYRRKQTIANGERYVTDELRDLQDRLADAQERAQQREAELFVELRQRCAAQLVPLRRLALQLADLDVHATFADLAHREAHVRPLIDRSTCIELHAARHPVVEASLPSGTFVPNDICLQSLPDDSPESPPRLMLLTGPNMAGKSTCMRQTAIAVILAQAGAFVPAARARIGIVDRLFTRIGASDQLARGQSTFMVEMSETAQMLARASQRSLVILDEIGRGTSTYDGLAIAVAIAEHLHDVVQCRAMFATHYHELCELAAERPGIGNFHVSAREVGDRIVFVHRLLPGAADRSYGIAVAQLAGLPSSIIARARQRLGQLQSPREQQTASQQTAPPVLLVPTPLALAREQIFDDLRNLDLERLTPLEALNALAALQAKLAEPVR